jgi:hypothetical protein
MPLGGLFGLVDRLETPQLLNFVAIVVLSR